MKESLKTVDENIEKLKDHRIKSFSELGSRLTVLDENSKELRKEAANLAQALSNSDVRGDWGEIHLRRVVELAGLQKHVDFVEQDVIKHEEGKVIPDMVVRLPGEQVMIVDSKFPAKKLLEALKIEDLEKRLELYKEHAAHLKKHIDALNKKNYHGKVKGAIQCIILFLSLIHI